MRGGRGGIRTPDRLPPMPVFKTGAFNHSATRPWVLWFAGGELAYSSAAASVL